MYLWRRTQCSDGRCSERIVLFNHGAMPAVLEDGEVCVLHATLAIIPGIFIGLTVLAFSVLGDSLRDVV